MATTIEIGMRWSRPRARLDPPTAVTNRISSVAYAVDEMASDENVARAIDLGRSWCSCSSVGMGRPTRSRFVNEYTGPSRYAGNVSAPLHEFCWPGNGRVA